VEGVARLADGVAALVGLRVVHLQDLQAQEQQEQQVEAVQTRISCEKDVLNRYGNSGGLKKSHADGLLSAGQQDEGARAQHHREVDLLLDDLLLLDEDQSDQQNALRHEVSQDLSKLKLIPGFV